MSGRAEELVDELERLALEGVPGAEQQWVHWRARVARASIDGVGLRRLRRIVVRLQDRQERWEARGQ